MGSDLSVVPLLAPPSSATSVTWAGIRGRDVHSPPDLGPPIGDRCRCPEVGVPLPSQNGQGFKFENGLAPRLGEVWGGPPRESALLRLLANLPETASCFSAPLYRAQDFPGMLDTNRRGNWCPPGVLIWLVGDRGVCSRDKMATAAIKKRAGPTARRGLGRADEGERTRTEACFSCLQMRRKRHLVSMTPWKCPLRGPGASGERIGPAMPKVTSATPIYLVNGWVRQCHKVLAIGRVE
jgi:hypothetical protein